KGWGEAPAEPEPARNPRLYRNLAPPSLIPTKPPFTGNPRGFRLCRCVGALPQSGVTTSGPPSKPTAIPTKPPFPGKPRGFRRCRCVGALPRKDKPCSGTPVGGGRPGGNQVVTRAGGAGRVATKAVASL